MTRGPRKYDAKAVEHEYVTGNDSLRSLAARHGVSFSSLAAYARREDWAGRKVAYQSSLARRTYDAMAMEQGDYKAVVLSESVKVARATLSVYAESLASRKVAVTPKDAVEMIRTLAELLRDPKEGGTNERVIIEGSARAVNADFLRRVADAARGQLAPEGVLAGATKPKPTGTRPN
jgi:hypothetical protein